MFTPRTIDSWLVGPDYIISKDIPGAQSMNPDGVGDLLTFPVVPPTGQHLHFSGETSWKYLRTPEIGKDRDLMTCHNECSYLLF